MYDDNVKVFHICEKLFSMKLCDMSVDETYDDNVKVFHICLFPFIRVSDLSYNSALSPSAIDTDFPLQFLHLRN
ncbi:unnamed protein product [Lactuca virosa]|uniref:Uncharacterized protein n=1 Tax=Lactuca virosa TaxID=75947 RepID=A0AAU9NFZ7_9ASTR|nr:unnamed protein product [Lactuca virosa]